MVATPETIGIQRLVEDNGYEMNNSNSSLYSLYHYPMANATYLLSNILDLDINMTGNPTTISPSSSILSSLTNQLYSTINLYSFADPQQAATTFPPF